MALTTRERGRLRAPTLRQLLDTPFPARRDLIAPWLRQGESCMIWAPTGVGKTMFSWSLALAMAGAASFLGWKAPEARRVLVVDGEMFVEDLIERARMLAPAIEDLDLETASENITVLARQYQDPEADFPDLATPEGRDELFQRVRLGRYDLVILDNFSTLCTIEDENAAAAMSPVLEFLLKLKQANVACILVHHSSKNGSAPRGSSKLEATFEVIIGLVRLSGGRSHRGASFQIEWTKFRGKRDETTAEREVFLHSERGAAEWVWQTSELDHARHLVNMVRSLEYPTQAHITAAWPLERSPNPGRAPSDGWLSKLKGKAIHTYKLINEQEWEDCIKAARQAPQGFADDGDDDENDDF